MPIRPGFRPAPTRFPPHDGTKSDIVAIYQDIRQGFNPLNQAEPFSF
jgi:hypothetical protein